MTSITVQNKDGTGVDGVELLGDTFDLWDCKRYSLILRNKDSNVPKETKRVEAECKKKNRKVLNSSG